MAGDREVFISYAHRDRAFVDGLAERMGSRGVAVWFDRGLVGTVVLVMVANLLVKWVLVRPDWFLSVAEFILAASLVALIYEILRRFLWAPALGGLYSEVQCCSRCGKESDRMALRCPGCEAMFKFE